MINNTITEFNLFLPFVYELQSYRPAGSIKLQFIPYEPFDKK